MPKLASVGLAPNAARVKRQVSLFLGRGDSPRPKSAALYFGRSNHQPKRRFFAADARRFFAPGVTLRCSLRLAAPLTPGFMLSHAPRLGDWRDCDPENRECYPWPMKGHARRTTANDK